MDMKRTNSQCTVTLVLECNNFVLCDFLLVIRFFLL